MDSPPALKTSAGIASAPGALPDFLVSTTVGNSSNRTFHSICGSLSIASSLMLDGVTKYSAYLSKTVSLSEKRVLPSTLSNVVATELFGP